MKKIGYNNWLINQQKENRLKRYKKITLFRRYWDVEEKEYTWEKKVNVEIDQDIIKCGKVTWKADTDQLNVWKMGNISLTVDNTHGKWDINNASGYFNGYIAFLSMIRIEVGFIAQDKTVYEIFVYQGLIATDGIQLDNDRHEAKVKAISLDYLIQSIDAEDVSKRPIYPELKYYDADIYSSTTIGKTGLGWGVNNYQNKIVRIFSGIGIGQERRIVSNTADTLTVSIWEITPDSTSDFEILGEYMGTADGSQTEWVTVQPGVGRIKGVWRTDSLREQGNHYETSQLNEIALGAKITFKIAPSEGDIIISNYIYWYQDQTFKYLVEKILDLIHITNKYVEDIIFVSQSNAEIEWEQTSQVDWQNGILVQSNAERYPGDIIADDNVGVSVKAYDMGWEPEDLGENYGVQMRDGWNAFKFKNTKSAYISHLSLLVYVYTPFFPEGSVECIIKNWENDDDPEAGSLFASATNTPTFIFGYQNLNFYFNNVRLIYGNYYWILCRRTSQLPAFSLVGSMGKLYTSGHRNPDKKVAVLTGDGWEYYPGICPSLLYYYHPYYSWGVHISQTLDCGVDLEGYGKIETREILNSGTAIYYTKSLDDENLFPESWNVEEWERVDIWGNIVSPVRRYLQVAVYFTPNNPGGGISADDIDTPFIQEYIVKYYVERYNPLLANFTDKNGKNAIEVMAKLANYKMGFFTDFDDSAHMIWDKEYDGDVMPQTEGWTENKGDNASGLIVSNELKITGDAISFDSVGIISESGSYVYNKVFLVEHDSNLYMSSGGINTIYRYDGGTTWTSIGSLPETTLTVITSLLSFDGNLYAGVQASSTGDRGVYRYDGGTTWTKISGLPSSAIAVYGLCEFDGNMYAGTSFGTVYRYDGGTTWTQIGNFAPNDYSIKFLLTYNNKLYAGADDNGSVYVYNGGSSWTKIKEFEEEFMGHMIVCGDYLYVGVLMKIYRYDGSTWITIGEEVNNQIGSFVIYNNNLFIGTQQDSHLYVYDGTSLIYLQNPGSSVWGMIKFNNKLYVGVGILSTEVFEFQSSGHCFYDITDTDLNPRNGWTVEANVEKTIGSDENFHIIINDGTFHTRVVITNQGYLKLLKYDKNDLTKSKKGIFNPGLRQTIKIARKGTLIKIYVNNEVVLMSYANNTSSYQKIYFGQFNMTVTTYQNVINWLRYNNSVPCFESFYFPKYYFQNRRDIIDSGLHLKVDKNYIKLYDFKNGWDKIYNYIKADYGGYSYYANPETELDESPNSKDKYGKRMFSVSGEDFLKAVDTNVAKGMATEYYSFYKNPRRRFKLFCEYLFQLNLSNKIYVSSSFPLTLTNLPCKIVGIVLDIDNFTLDLDCEEII